MCSGTPKLGTLEIKRAYEPASAGDGMRILVDRLWPRGVSKDAAQLDFWCKEIAPTPELRVWFAHRADRFTDFKKRYLDELRSNPAVSDLLERIGRSKATLVYGAKDPAVNHAVVLAAFLKKAQAKTQTLAARKQPAS